MNNNNTTQTSFPFNTITANNITGSVGVSGSTTWTTVFISPTPSNDDLCLPPEDDIDLAVPVEKINKDGCKCKKCKEYYPFAQANQDDGTLICWSCRRY